MATYTISGDYTVAGKNPGESVSDAELDGCNIPALIESGHLTVTSEDGSTTNPATETDPVTQESN